MSTSPRPSPISFGHSLLLAGAGISVFHLAYGVPAFSFALPVFLWCLIQLGGLASSRPAFYAGLLSGVGIYAPQLGFFWSLFGPAALVLWIILAFWVGLFVLLCHLARRHLGPLWSAVTIPFFWTGLEYFRSELYYLRFSWLNVGFAFAESPNLSSIAFLGVYGIGFVAACLAAIVAWLPGRRALFAGSGLLLGLVVVTNARLGSLPAEQGLGRHVTVVGIQAEFPLELEVPGMLEKARQAYPQAELFMLSEYAFDGPIPARVKQWCRENGRYLVAGGRDILSPCEFYNTAFVIDPSGEVVFKQAKSVPIQFFKDGRPAPGQRVWESPWGKLGIGICYDLSYSRVTDALIRQGAQALLIPTMDVMDWGRHEHALHARVAPMKAAEYGVPIFRVASSGVSQLVGKDGRTLVSLPFPVQGSVMAGELQPAVQGRRPLDRYLAPFSTVVTALLSVGFIGINLRFCSRWGRELPKAGPFRRAHEPGGR